uniref:polynucleotide adenylyltransferase n=2 Tax=Mesocestoides corti TaxID=53468 RepID=A0A5K3FGS5_MESCO
MSQTISPSDIPPQCLGETGALNFKPPTEQDLKDSAALEEALAQMNIFETQEEIHQRREALIKLQEISNRWIYKKALEQNLPEHNALSTTGKIFTFGSYRLGVNFRGADIDALLVVPRFITREEFFSDFQALLSEEDSVEDLHAVPDAFVPVLKLKFMGVEIDLLFAQIDMMSVRSDFNLSENSEQLLRNMDERDVRSVNGVRVTEDMLNLVYPKDVFKTALKVIRLWAKRKNIYSNAIGFLGGVSWAILTCRICQLYPCASPSTIVYLFFTIFSQWPWPKPVRLRESEYIPTLNLPVWDPRHNPTDQYHLMPILTPSYPSQNSTYNVQRSNRIIIEREIKQGLAVVKEILLRKRTWSDLFEPAFFFTYRHYVVVIVSGEEKRCFMERCGLVESRLRVLVSNAESNRYVKIAHVNCRAYGKGPQDGDAAFVKKWFIGMEFDRNPTSSTTLTNHTATAAVATTAADSSAPPPKLNIDLSDVISSFEIAIERGMSAEDTRTSVTVKYAKRSHLSQFISPEDMEEIRKQSAAHVTANQSNPGGLTRHGSNLSQMSASNSPRNCDSPNTTALSPAVAPAPISPRSLSASSAKIDASKEKTDSPQTNPGGPRIGDKRHSTDASLPPTNGRLRVPNESPAAGEGGGGPNTGERAVDRLAKGENSSTLSSEVKRSRCLAQEDQATNGSTTSPQSQAATPTTTSSAAPLRTGAS